LNCDLDPLRESADGSADEDSAGRSKVGAAAAATRSGANQEGLLGVPGSENPVMLSTVHFAGNDLQFRLETTYADVEMAKTGEKDALEAVQTLAKDLGAAAVSKSIQAAKVERREKQVIVEALLPAADLKPSLWKLLKL
jgi:hypothetical protein